MQPQISTEYSASQSPFGSVRRPIQCEGIERGHRRMAEVAVSGSVNPQFNWADILAHVDYQPPMPQGGLF